MLAMRLASGLTRRGEPADANQIRRWSCTGGDFAVLLPALEIKLQFEPSSSKERIPRGADSAVGTSLSTFAARADITAAPESEVRNKIRKKGTKVAEVGTRGGKESGEKVGGWFPVWCGAAD